MSSTPDLSSDLMCCVKLQDLVQMETHTLFNMHYVIYTTHDEMTPMKYWGLLF